MRKWRATAYRREQISDNQDNIAFARDDLLSLLSALSYVCSQDLSGVYSYICVLSCPCSQMCVLMFVALICVFSCVCYLMFALMCVLISSLCSKKS